MTDPFKQAISLLQDAFDLSHDQGDEAHRLRNDLLSAYRDGLHDPDDGIEALQNVQHPEGGHRLELIGMYLLNAHLYHLKAQGLQAARQDIPDGLEAMELGLRKLKAGDRSGKKNIADSLMSGHAGNDAAICRIMIHAAVGKAFDLSSGLRTGAIGKSLPDAIVKLKEEFTLDIGSEDDCNGDDVQG